MLAQLGNRVQHALRAFTPDDAKALTATVRTFPRSDFYDIEELLRQLGIGEAAVTILNENGVPTPVVHTQIRAPRSKMAPAADVDGAAKASPLYAKYGTRVDAQSAREMLAARMVQQPPDKPTEEHKKAAKASGGGAGAVGDFLNSPPATSSSARSCAACSACSPSRSSRPGRREPRARRCEVLRNHLHVGEHRHEVRVPRPARDDV